MIASRIALFAMAAMAAMAAMFARFARFATFALFASFCMPAHAQEYPGKLIRIMLGGGPDAAARMIAEKLQAAWGQPVIVENKPQVGGTIMSQEVANAAPDGHTLMFCSSGQFMVLPVSKVGYDMVRDFAPVTQITTMPFVLSVHPSVPAGSAKELIALAKAKPGELAYGSGGNGSGAHVSGEMLKMLAKINLTHIPYKGVGPAQIDLLAGQIQLVFGGVPSTAPQIRTGRLRALGVTGPKRVVTFPDLPTIAESGVPNYDVTMWYGVLAPAGTPQTVVMKLHGAVNRALHTPDLNERLLADGSEPSGMLPDEFSAFIKSELMKWAPVIKASGAKPD